MVVAIAKVVEGEEYSSAASRAAALESVRRLQEDVWTSLWALDRPRLWCFRFHISLDAMSVAKQERFN